MILITMKLVVMIKKYYFITYFMLKRFLFINTIQIKTLVTWRNLSLSMRSTYSVVCTDGQTAQTVVTELVKRLTVV